MSKQKKPLFFIILIFLGIWLPACQWFSFDKPEEFPASDSAAATPTGSSGVVKIYTRESGIYEVRLETLEQAGFQANTPPNQWRLFQDANEIPFFISGENQDMKLRFFAPQPGNLYSAEKIFWLVQDPEAVPEEERWWELGSQPPVTETMDTAPGSIALPSSGMISSQHLEENLVYNPQVEQGEHWLWANLAAPKVHAYEASFSNLIPGESALRMMVWGVTEDNADPDHHLIVRMNGQVVADEKWDGKGRHLIQAAIPAGGLVEGKNQIEVEAPADTQALADIVFLDWIDIEAPRRLVAQDDRLNLTRGASSGNLEGFSGEVTVYDVTSVQVSEDIGNGSEYPFKPGHQYWAVGPQGFLSPARIELPTSATDLRSLSGGDYIAIGPPDLLEASRDLLEFRQSQGLSTLAVPIQAVFDQFSGGIPEPAAIRDFMRYAVKEWQEKPRFLLLVGDSTFDPKGYQAAPEANRVPTFFVDTQFGGETASDVEFAMVDGDNLPDLAVGRIPARTALEVRTLVEKTLNYERLLDTQGNKREVLAIADGQEASFKMDAQNFLGLFPADYATELIAPQAGAAGTNQVIAEQLTNGDRLVAYFGHGSITMWGKDRLFTIDDVTALDNRDKLPIVINMTCLTGLFIHPQQQSLTEAFLFTEKGGAVAILAPTSLTLPTDQSFLSRPLVERMLAQPALSLGELLTEARRQASVEAPGAQDVLLTFLLFGDPALSINP
jgi:hypothetical protein